MEACEWLKLAGFPQYAQMYKGNSNDHFDKKNLEIMIYLGDKILCHVNYP